MSGIDVNPVPYGVVAIASRFWLSLIYTGQAAITNVPTTLTGWVGVIVLGVVPDFPLVVQLLIAAAIDVPLVFGLAYGIKRLLSLLTA